ncbi:MAG: T9SS type A sorting domain-containing protein [Bacteroidia bacterium]
MKKRLLIFFLFVFITQIIQAQCAGNCTLYTQSAIAFSLSPVGGNTLTLGDDQISTAVPIGFTFTFMCSAYTQMYVSSNGFISFNAASGNGCCSGGFLPTTAANPNNLVAFLWTDLYPPSGGTITYSTQGTAPNRVCIITYSNIAYYPGSGSVTGQIKLFETSNVIEIHSGSASADSHLKTQGIEDQPGTIGQATPGRNSVNFSISTPDAYSFSPGAALPACTLTPNAGAAVSSPTSGCGNLTVNLGLSGTSGTCSATYQWQSAANSSGPFTNISGATAPTAIVTTTATSYYQCIISCGTNSAVSSQATVVITATTCPVQCAQNCTLYTQSAITNSLSPVGGNNLVLGDDQVSSAVPIGFTFTFMCNAYTQMYVCSNGFITFNPASSNGCCSGGFLPTAGANPNNLIAFLWTDLYPPSGGTITYSTQGTAPNRVCIITYSNIAYYPGSGSVTGQIKLFETTNVIEIHSNSASADTHIKTQGIENQAGTIGQATPGRNNVNFSISTPDAYSFIPASLNCSVAPTPGTAVAIPSAGCGTVTTTVSLSGASGTCGAIYQWQSATNSSGPFTNIAGATTSTVASTTTLTMYFNCVLACGTASATSSTETVVVTPAPCLLPIQLLNFYLNDNGSYCDINWETASEHNSDFFLVEKSNNGFDFTSLGKVPAAGNSTQLKKYSLRDADPVTNSIIYYRLKQFDKGNNDPRLSVIRVLDLKNKMIQKIKLQPNPASTSLEIHLPENFINRNITIQIFGYSGKRISTVTLSKSTSDPVYILNVENLASGLYNVQAFDESGESMNATFIKD